MTYNVLSGTLNTTIPHQVYVVLFCCCRVDLSGSFKLCAAGYFTDGNLNRQYRHSLLLYLWTTHCHCSVHEQLAACNLVWEFVWNL